MVRVDQIQRGFAEFVDKHVAVAYNGIEKAIVLAGATLLAANFPGIISQYSNHPMVSAFGIYDSETGGVDIEAVYNAIAQHIGTEKIPISFPRLGSINLGTIKIGREELDQLYRYIKEA